MSKHYTGWQRALTVWAESALQNTRRDVVVSERHIMWEALREAAMVSRIAYRGPPSSDYPRKSSMPEVSDDVTYWQIVSGYLQGQIDDMRPDKPREPMPSADQVSRAEEVLEVWHSHALKRKGAGARIKKAVYMKACGVPDRKVRAVTGLTKQAIHAAKDEAMDDMWTALRSC